MGGDEGRGYGQRAARKKYAQFSMVLLPGDKERLQRLQTLTGQVHYADIMRRALAELELSLTR